MKQTEQSITGTGFHGTTLVATVNDLVKVLGQPSFVENTGEDKTNYEWDMETDSGELFTIYDYKEYRPISKTERIKWHVGGFNSIVTQKAREQILEAIIQL